MKRLLATQTSPINMYIFSISQDFWTKKSQCEKWLRTVNDEKKFRPSKVVSVKSRERIAFNWIINMV